MTTATVSSILECKDVNEKIVLCESHSIYIKPLAKLNITIQLPPTKTAGQTVSSAEIIDKLRKHSLPEEYLMLRIIKSTLEFIRFEAEIENKSSLKALLSKLDNSTIKMPSFTDVLKIRVAEAKIVYPLKHDWDTFYNVSANVNVNEMKNGERPDTIHIQDMPCRWFSDKKSLDSKKPSESILKEVFSVFGEIRCIDIPILYNQKFYQQKSDVFDAYIQYKEYFSFVKAMDTFRGMKMLHIDNETKQAFTANIRVDFDRTKHLSEREIQKRNIDRLKAIELEKIKNAQLEKEKDKAAKKQEIANYKQLLEESAHKDENTSDKSMTDEAKTKEQRRKEREEIRRKKRLGKKQAEEEKKLTLKIAIEERKILIAQRKLESMRLLEELFNRVKNSHFNEEPVKKIDEIKISSECVEVKGEVASVVENEMIEVVNVEEKKEVEEEKIVAEEKVEVLIESNEKKEIVAEIVDVDEETKENLIKDEQQTKENVVCDESSVEIKEIVKEKSSPSKKEKRKEKKEKKRKRQETEKEEHDLREKILRLKQKDNNYENIDNEAEERDDLRKRISGAKILKASFTKNGNESDSSENSKNFYDKYRVDKSDRKSLSIE